MTSPGQVALIERNDVHKSCKSMETLVNILNDYCEAAGAIAQLEKKLAKALRDAAGLKATGDVAANALNASATIFDILADTNGKFTKVADKEYDYVSTEVKKWFKKLAKEEKAHGERIANADAKIKQAGQAYEKKVKKNPRDANDEHARYINLITTLGPEITQEKYNHALTVTQRHTATTYTLAGCLARIADAEWLKTCEGVRRFSPTIGPLGEFRSLCEGGWVGPMPEGFPDMDDPQQHSGGLDGPTSDRTDEESPTIPQEVLRDAPRRRPKSAEPPSNTQHLGPPQQELNQQRSQSPSSSPGHLHPYNTQPPQPQRSHSPTSDGHEQFPFEFPRPLGLIDMQTGSVRSLSAFPSPPTHVPVLSRPQPAKVSTQPFPLLGRVITNSPVPEGTDDEGPQAQSSRAPPSTEARGVESVRSSPEQVYQNHMAPPTKVEEEPQPPPQLPPASHQSPSSSPVLPSPAITRRTSLYESRQSEDRDFGIRRSMDSPGAKPPPPSAAETNRVRSVERTDTGGSNGSIVAAMRSRYTGGSSNISALQKDVPKLPLPLSVTEMAARYQPIDGPTSPPRTRAMSPTQSSQQRQLPTPQPSEVTKPTPPSPSPGPTPGDDELNRHRRQRLDEIAEHELNERERHLRDREQQIHAQTQELERERARLYSTSNRDSAEPSASYTNVSQMSSVASPSRGHQHRERRSSQQTPHSQMDSGPSHMQYSRSQPQPQPPPRDSRDLQPPSSPSYPHPSSRPSSRPPSRLESTSHTNRPSITSYQQLPSPIDSRGLAPSFPQPNYAVQPNALRSDKPKGGWMRRLSMPVVSNAFSSDSKKGTGNVGISSKTMFAVDGKRNTSTTNLKLGAGVTEDGRLSTRR
ncbi:hypothetical protein BDN72DRAFT_563199 [Pluteus cervinus]|uniref:Uncharacterized protein n=1 Tax=Pluteus cervinus TaxID=181527 RepID=A0ACD3BAM8_9AGAR|nr:hypothetical protein BDN72DRAFT_563199 [Pluteus cervinus]